MRHLAERVACVARPKRPRGPRREGGAASRPERVERAAGAFERVLELPEDPDPEGSRATYADGLLMLDIPKRSGGKGRSIPIVKGKKS